MLEICLVAVYFHHILNIIDVIPVVLLCVSSMFLDFESVHEFYQFESNKSNFEK